MSQFANGQASKFLVALFSAAASALATYWGSARWEPAAVMGIGAVLTYLIPNAAPPAPLEPPAAPAKEPLGM